MKRFLFVFVLLGSVAVLYWTPAGSERLTHNCLTPISLVEDLYPSMLGPADTNEGVRLSAGEPELVWITGYSAEMVGPDGKEPRSQEFMCHNTLSFHYRGEERGELINAGHFNQRLFTLSQGQSRIDFPEGFGIPVSSTESFMLQSQVMNTHPEWIGQEVRHAVSTDFVKEAELEMPMHALALVDFGVRVEVADPQAREAPDNLPTCAPDAGGQRTATDHDTGTEYTAHWVVKPGREIRTTRVGKVFPFDTTAHYISVHLHSYAKYLELRDLTTGERVFRAEARPTASGTGLAELDYYSSASGLRVYADHEYELESCYENTTDQEVTAMAFMLCYIKDPTFISPSPEELRRRSDEFCARSR